MIPNFYIKKKRVHSLPLGFCFTTTSMNLHIMFAGANDPCIKLHDFVRCVFWLFLIGKNSQKLPVSPSAEKSMLLIKIQGSGGAKNASVVFTENRIQ